MPKPPASKLKVVEVPIKDLVPYDKNSRTHSPEQIKQIIASIKQFGWTNPVLATPENRVIAGHGRLLAAAEMGWETVPTIHLAGLSDAQVRALTIADNQIAANAGWDIQLLAEEVQRLVNEDFDAALLGFDQSMIDRLLAEATPVGATDPDAIPPVPEVPVCRKGDVWQLGQHVLGIGDCLDVDLIEQVMAGEGADLIWTDPPWNVAYGSNLANGRYKDRTIKNDDMEPEQWAEFVSGFTGSFKIMAKPGCLLYCAMSTKEWPTVDKGLRDAGFHWSSTIIWVKDSAVLTRKDYHTRFEPIWYGGDDRGPRIMKVPDRKQNDVWEIARPKRSEEHPTMKPVELIARSLDNSSARGAVVADPFGGSGSTLIACEQHGRRCRTIELDEKYGDVIITRWQDFTGKQAVLRDGGDTFAQVGLTRA